jgi:thiosulfate dehydrogenase
MSADARKLAIVAACVIAVGVIIGCAQSMKQAKTPQAIVADHMAQWKDRNPDRANRWVEEEKERHAVQPPADNSPLLKGDQAKGDTYGRVTERDLLIWSREAEKMAVSGSRIFHSADLLGGTVGVSCDMCHPDAANTHPETYPKFQPQLGRVALLRDMINWCIQQPVRGKALAPDSPEMRALEAYIIAQRKGTPLNYGKH